MGEPLKRRKERLDYLKTLHEDNPSWDKDRLIAFFCWITGITEKTAQGYLILLERAGEM
jgi:hypothetical protein